MNAVAIVFTWWDKSIKTLLLITIAMLIYVINNIVNSTGYVNIFNVKMYTFELTRHN